MTSGICISLIFHVKLLLRFAMTKKCKVTRKQHCFFKCIFRSQWKHHIWGIVGEFQLVHGFNVDGIKLIRSAL